MHPAVFLDRDGVVNRAVVCDGKPYPPATCEDVVFPEGTSEAIRSLRTHGYRVIIVTNQPDVAKGKQTREVVEAIHRLIMEQLQVDDIRVCYHVDEDRCHCRKPKPGMIIEAAREHSIDLARSYMIGDRWRDIEAGKAAGCRTILIRPEVCYREEQCQGMDAAVETLSQAAALILNNSFDIKGE
jgi:D-glycero-D-manno-heptose 1,7-bisphosphate phosphatase